MQLCVLKLLTVRLVLKFGFSVVRFLGGMKQVMNPAPAEERPAKRGRGRGEGQERRGRRGDRAADKGE